MPVLVEGTTIMVGKEVAEAVLAAFDAARESGKSPVDCYQAGVMAWRSRFPEHDPTFAAQKAVTIILDASEAKLRGRVLAEM